MNFYTNKVTNGLQSIRDNAVLSPSKQLPQIDYGSHIQRIPKKQVTNTATDFYKDLDLLRQSHKASKSGLRSEYKKQTIDPHQGSDHTAARVSTSYMKKPSQQARTKSTIEFPKNVTPVIAKEKGSNLNQTYSMGPNNYELNWQPQSGNAISPLTGFGQLPNRKDISARERNHSTTNMFYKNLFMTSDSKLGQTAEMPPAQTMDSKLKANLILGSTAEKKALQRKPTVWDQVSKQKYLQDLEMENRKA